MSNKNPLRVLIVEDDHNWRGALCEMYKDIVYPDEVILHSAASGPEAIRFLENEKYDVLSLDINLGSTHPRESNEKPDIGIPGADGRTVLRKAEELSGCNSVIVITGIHIDDTLSFFLTGEEVNVVRMTLQIYLNETFPGNHLYLMKMNVKEKPMREQIDIFKEQITRERLYSISGKINKFIKNIDNTWCIRYNGVEIHPKHAVGFERLQYLIQNPYKSIDGTTLARIGSTGVTDEKIPSAEVDEGQLIGQGLNIRDTNNEFDTTIDLKGRGEIRKKIKRLERELEDAEEFGKDSSEIEKLKGEIVDLQAHLNPQRDTKESPVRKKIRDSVTKSINRTIDSLKKMHPDLADHLDKSIQRGYYVSYNPEKELDWKFE